MPAQGLTRAALALGLCLLAVLLLAALAFGRGAIVETGNLILRADGGFKPRTLPERDYRPITFGGFAAITSRDGTRPVALRQAVIDLDADGRLGVAGLPSCPPERVANASVAEARRACLGAVVGTGRVAATISLASGPIVAESPLTAFNGPRVGGDPSVLLHAQTTEPGTQTFAIVAPIERIRGAFGYRVRIDVPLIAAGLGSLTLIKVEVGRRYTAAGKRRSYVAARCPDNILATRGRFLFEDGTVISGAVEKFCRSLPSR